MIKEGEVRAVWTRWLAWSMAVGGEKAHVVLVEEDDRWAVAYRFGEKGSGWAWARGGRGGSG
jgi:hypothetical protein